MESTDAVEPWLVIPTDKTPPSEDPNNEPVFPTPPLPSTTPAAESGYPLRVDSNGSRVSGNRTSMSSEVKPSRKQKSIEKRQKRWRCIYRPLTRLFLFLMGLLILLLIWRIFDHLLKIHITAARVWEFLPQPVDPHFDYFSISSSSETCSEFAREWAQADKSVIFVSIFLTVCLSCAEPHQTGISGSSVSVFGDAEKNSCYYMDGSATSIPNLPLFRRALDLEPNSEHIGAYSVAIPGEFRNIAALNELYRERHANDENSKELVWALGHVLKEIVTYNMRFPVSASLARTLEASNMDSQMVFRKKLARNVLGDQLETLEEGSLFEPVAVVTFQLYVRPFLRTPGINMLHHDLITFLFDVINVSKTASLDGKGTGITIAVLNYLSSQPSLNAFEPIVGEPMEPIDIGGGVSGCVSRTGGKGTLQPRTPVHMKSYKRPDTDSTPPTEDIRIYQAIFESMDALQNSTVNQPSDFYHYWTQDREKAKTFEIDLDFLEKQKARRIEPHAPWAASMIAVVDHRNKQAFARTGTLGTGYGSLLQTSGDNIVLNNLMSQFGRYNSEVKGHQNDLQPMILFKNGKVLTAYAGSGGYLTRSLDLARQFTSLIFSVFYDVPLAKALTTPLHFALPEKKLFLSRGLPYSYANNIRKDHKDEKVVNEESLIDMAAAVHNGRSVFFNGDDDVIEGQVMPNGF